MVCHTRPLPKKNANLLPLLCEQRVIDDPSRRHPSPLLAGTDSVKRTSADRTCQTLSVRSALFGDSTWQSSRLPALLSSSGASYWAAVPSRPMILFMEAKVRPMSAPRSGKLIATSLREPEAASAIDSSHRRRKQLKSPSRQPEK